MGDLSSNRPAPTASGTLARTPFVHLLLYALGKKLTGAIELHSPDNRSALVVFSGGEPVKARTSEAVAYLGNVLVELGHLDPAQLDRSLAELAKQKAGGGNQLHGALLLSAGVIDAPKLRAGLIDQLGRKLRFIAALPGDTTYAYYDGVDLLRGWGGDDSPAVDPVPYLWGMLREYPPWEHVRTALGRMLASPLRLARGADLARLRLAKEEVEALGLLRARPLRASELARAAHLNERTAQLLTYLLLITRQVDVLPPVDGAAASPGPLGQGPFGQGPSPLPLPSPSPSPSPPPPSPLPPGARASVPFAPPTISFRGRESSGSPEVSTHGRDPAGPPDVSIRGRDPAGPPDPSMRPSVAPMSGRLAPSPASARPPSSASRPAPPSSPRPPTSPSRSSRPPSLRSIGPPPPGLSAELVERWREIGRRAATIDRSDYFMMLDLARDATREDIEESFFALAKRWHPDRLPPELAPVRDACSRVFARMNEAHATLANDDLRARYMKLLAEGSGSPEMQEAVAKVVSAAQKFQKAEVCFKRNDLAQAETFCRQALDEDPTQPDYIAMLAWLVALKPESQSAEETGGSIKMLDKAISMSERCERAYYWRGMLHKRLGKTDLALKDFRRAAELNPRNIDAVREVRLHRMRGGRSSAPPPAATRKTTPPKNEEAGKGIFGRLFKK
jgi:tetratricopeptide (TPR) repeat protein